MTKYQVILKGEQKIVGTLFECSEYVTKNHGAKTIEKAAQTELQILPVKD